MKLTRRLYEEGSYNIFDHKKNEIVGKAEKCASEKDGSEVWEAYHTSFSNDGSTHTDTELGEHRTLTQSIEAIAAYLEAKSAAEETAAASKPEFDPEAELQEMGDPVEDWIPEEDEKYHFIEIANVDELTREQWLELRKSGIGGSEAAAVAGMSKYKSPMSVYLEKTGRIEPDDLSDNERVHWGNVLEDVIAREFQQRTGFDVDIESGMLRSTRYPWMLANLDRVVYDPIRNDWGILECKTTDARNSKAWEDGQCPDDYFLQVQHYLAVTGYNFAHIAVLIGGNKFVHFEIVRDEEIISMLVEKEREFWNCLQDGIQPPVDGSEACDKALLKRFPAHEEGKRVDVPASLCEQLEEATRIADAACAEVERIKQEVKEQMGDAETAYCDGELAFTWKCSKSRETFDSKKFKADHPELAKQYVKEGKATRSFLVK